MIRYRGYELLVNRDTDQVDIWWRHDKIDSAATLGDARKLVDDWLDAP